MAVSYLSRLAITNYRNLVSLDLELPTGVVVFFGSNAQGKTALLEAVYTMAIARSFRAENEREVVNFKAAADGEMALVGGVIQSQGTQLQVYVGYQSMPGRQAATMGDQGASGRGQGGLSYSVRKQIRVSRVRRTASELVGMVHAVLFSAEDIELVLGPPSGRRRFLDIILSQTDPMYVKSLQRYQKVIQQRNQLLRLVRDGRAGREELEFWTGELVTEGSWLTWRRHQIVGRLGPLCDQKHGELSGPGGEFSLIYKANVPLADAETGMEANFREALAAVEARERATATTAAGPHRDDFDLLIDGVDMGTFASRGQARTLALTLKLAEAAYLATTRTEGPMVLLDDVLSEMDSARRRRVLEQASQYQQTLITTTDVELAHDFFAGEAAYFQVEAGVVTPVDGGNVIPAAANTST